MFLENIGDEIGIGYFVLLSENRRQPYTAWLVISSEKKDTKQL